MLRNNKRINASRGRRRLLNEPCVLMLKKLTLEDKSEAEQVDCFIPSTNHFVRILGSSVVENDLLALFRNGGITSGHTTLMKDGTSFDDDGNLILLNLEGVAFGGEERRRKLAVTTGTKKLLAVRIIAPDASTTSTESQISDAWFGTAGDAVNLKSQYEACSYNTIQINPANETIIKNDVTNIVSNGVYTVAISTNVIGASDGTIRNAAVDAATTSLGSLPDQFDHVMLCLPSGTGTWIAYAYVNHWLSVYNNQWCNYVSGQMHGKSNIHFYPCYTFHFFHDSNPMRLSFDSYPKHRNWT